MQFSLSVKSAAALALTTVFLAACGGGGSSSDSSDGGSNSTAAIAGLWELPDDTVLGFQLLEISSDGVVSDWREDTINNCYTTFDAKLVNQGNNSYGYVSPIIDEVIISYTLVKEGSSLRYTSSFLSIDESWQAVEGVSTSDFNICP